MKNCVSIITLYFLMSFSFGQNIPYLMNTSQGDYQDLSNPISINNGEAWTRLSSYPVYFNFDFDIMGQTYNSLNVKSGGLEFPGYGTKYLQVIFTPFGSYFLRDRGDTISMSPLEYEIIGESGQQILKFQCENAGFEPWAGFDTINDFINYQVWLFEEDDHIEIHFGPNSSNYGITFSDFIDTKFVCNSPFAFTIYGNANNPSFDWIDYSYPTYYFLEGLPSDGIIYTIYPNPNYTNVKNLNNVSGLTVFPNPFQDYLVIKGQLEKEIFLDINIFDSFGRTCFQQSINITSKLVDQKIDLANLKHGIYILIIKDRNGQVLLRQLVNCH